MQPPFTMAKLTPPLPDQVHRDILLRRAPIQIMLRPPDQAAAVDLIPLHQIPATVEAMLPLRGQGEETEVHHLAAVAVADASNFF